MKYLVTGASGFMGRHLVERLAHDGHDVTVWIRSDRDFWPGMRIVKAINDITDRQGVVDALTKSNPDVIFHLAAQSLPTRSWNNPLEAVRVNIDGTLNLLDALRSGHKACRLIIACSSGQYSTGFGGTPIPEDAPMNPDSPYGITKMAADSFSALYGRAYALDIVRFRPFSCIGIYKEGDIASDLAKRIVAIERGAKPQLLVGRTDIVRDIIDVHDCIAALLLLAQKAQRGQVFNICRGQGISIADLIEQFRTLTTVSFELEPDPRLIRPVDELIRIGDPTRLNALGWHPRISLKESVRTVLDFWRNTSSAK